MLCAVNLCCRAQNLISHSPCRRMLRSSVWGLYFCKESRVSCVRHIAYISRKLLPRETRYSVVEKECMAVKWALDSFKYYLLGRRFNLETDHRALTWLGRMKDTNARITQWFLSMQPFVFDVVYRKGPQNCTADFLSRTPQGVSKRRGRKCHGAKP